MVVLSVFEFGMIVHFGRAFSRLNNKLGSLAGTMGCNPTVRYGNCPAKTELAAYFCLNKSSGFNLGAAFVAGGLVVAGF
jgi:hypothetical protein